MVSFPPPHHLLLCHPTLVKCAFLLLPVPANLIPTSGSLQWLFYCLECFFPRAHSLRSLLNHRLFKETLLLPTRQISFKVLTSKKKKKNLSCLKLLTLPILDYNNTTRSDFRFPFCFKARNPCLNFATNSSGILSLGSLYYFKLLNSCSFDFSFWLYSPSLHTKCLVSQ